MTAVVLGLISPNLGDGTNKPQPKEDLKAVQVSAPSVSSLSSPAFVRCGTKEKGYPGLRMRMPNTRHTLPKAVGVQGAS